MRKIRNTELYNGGVLITIKQSEEYFNFVSKAFKKSEGVFKKLLGALF